MNSVHLTTLSLTALILIATPVRAVQVIEVKPGGVFKVDVSIEEYNLIGMWDGSFLSSVKATGSKVLIDKDDEAGQALVKPVRGYTGAFTVFVRDGEGNTYTLRATPGNRPAETIFLKPSDTEKAFPANKEIPWQARVKETLRQIARGDDPTGYTRTDESTVIPIWQETQVMHIATWYGSFQIDVLGIRNVTETSISLSERDFARFGDKVRAVAILQHELDAGTSTLVYVVRDS